MKLPDKIRENFGDCTITESDIFEAIVRDLAHIAGTFDFERYINPRSALFLTILHRYGLEEE
jgi:hypothetical protein